MSIVCIAPRDLYLRLSFGNTFRDRLLKMKLTLHMITRLMSVSLYSFMVFKRSGIDAAMRVIIPLVILGLCSSDIYLSAQSHRAVVRFYVGDTVLRPDIFSNRQALDSLRSVAIRMSCDSSVTMTGIHFKGYASPEGPHALNRRLSRQRRQALENYVRTYCSWPDSLADSSDAVYDSIMAADYISASPAARKDLLKSLDMLRYASVDIEYRQRVPLHDRRKAIDTGDSDYVARSVAGISLRPVIPADAPDEIIGVAVAGTSEGSCSPLYIGLKTNMLYDALLIPTLGADIHVGRRLSVSGQWSYAWWSRDRRHRYWRYYGGDLGIRWWFGRQARVKPLSGHHVGVYAQIFTYDFETGGRGEMGAKFNYGGGVEYGFSLPLRRRLSIDFSIGVGYIGGRYYDYKPIDGHYVWQATRNRRWVGPTKAEISIVWLIGCGNYNVKGGL